MKKHKTGTLKKLSHFNISTCICIAVITTIVTFTTYRVMSGQPFEKQALLIAIIIYIFAMLVAIGIETKVTNAIISQYNDNLIKESNEFVDIVCKHRIVSRDECEDVEVLIKKIKEHYDEFDSLS